MASSGLSSPAGSATRDFGSVQGPMPPGGGTQHRTGYTDNSSGSDMYYKQKMRHGFIDLRNSYNEKIKPRTVTYTRSLGAPPPAPYPDSSYKSSNSSGSSSHKSGYFSSHGSAPNFQQQRPNESKGLYRSNSSLELEHAEYHENIPEPMSRPLHRDYGSASSLDVKSAAVVRGQAAGGDSFFAMLQDYHPDNQDQRAQAPPHIQDVLRGRADVEGGSRGLKQHDHDLTSPVSVPRTFDVNQYGMDLNQPSYNSVPQIEDDPPSGNGQQSPKLRTKSQKQKNKDKTSDSGSSGGGGGLLRKLRGKTESSDSERKTVDKSPSGDLDPSRLDDRYRRKAFVHFDCQSVGVNLVETATQRSAEGTSSVDLKLKNTTTGASAASGARNDRNEPEEGDSGDGKSNDMLLSCPFFRNELGGEEEQTICLNRNSAQKRVQQLLGNMQAPHFMQSGIHSPLCNGVAVLDTAQGPSGLSCTTLETHQGLVVEFVDCGAMYYRNFFHGFDHQNFVGVDEKLGPIAISFRREKVDDKERETSTGKQEGGGVCYQYRIIVRTGELGSLRGSVIEEAIPSSSRLSNTRGLPPKDVLEFLFPGEINLSCLKMASVGGPSIGEQLLKLDEQRVTKTYKVGIMLCRAGQQTEEEMYNNEHGSPAFEEFLDCIGERVRLKGFEGYRGGLDCKTDSTGTHSLYKQIEDYEIMYHVSTMLPFTSNNRQQLLRKRHIGNDIVTIVFQEPGALPFTPKSVRSHFQHVFIIVKAHHPNTDHVKYSLAVTRSKDVPPFGPPFADGAMFSRSPEFAHFLLIKAINAENAVHCSEKFLAMARRTHGEYMKELVSSTAGSTSMDSASKLSKFSLGSGRRKERPKVRTIPDVFATGALVWSVQSEDFSSSSQIECYLAIGSTILVLTDVATKRVLVAIPCKAIIGWTPNGRSLRIYFNHSECVMVRVYPSEVDEVSEITARLSLVTRGASTEEYTLRRNSLGQLGFHVHYEGIISEIEQHGYAWNVGLRDGARLVEICKVATCTLTHDQMIDLLRTSVTVKVVIIPPHEDGTPRRGFEDSRLAALLAHISYRNSGGSSNSLSALPERPISQQLKQYKLEWPNNHHLHHDHLRGAYPAPPMSAPPTGSFNRVDGQKLSPRNFAEDYSVPRPSENIHHSWSHGSLPAMNTRPSNERLAPMAPPPPPMENEGSGGRGAWSGKVTVYPAYSKDQSKEEPPTAVAEDDDDEEDHWMTQSLPARGYEPPLPDRSRYHPSNMHRRTSPNDIHRSTEAIQSEESSLERKRKLYHHHPHPSNASDSRSSGGGSLNSSLTREDKGEMRGIPRIPSKGHLKQGHLISTHSTGSLGDASTSNHGSAHSSPIIPRRPLKHQDVGPSASATPLRPNKSTSSKNVNDTFQEDLIRLIDPDVSFSLAEAEQGDGAPGPMHRARSDDSICASASTRPSRSRTLETHGSSDAIFGGGLPLPPPRDHSLKEHKLSPRVTKDLPGTVLRVRTSRPRSAHAPENSSEWNSLVETATKALQDDSGPSVSERSANSSGRSAGNSSANDTSSRHLLTSSSPEVSGNHSQQSALSHSSDNLSQRERIIQLENQVEALQKQLQQEQREKAALESEVHRLQDDNVRLQEESQTAAAQLRKFTEWFFNTIDRQ